MSGRRRLNGVRFGRPFFIFWSTPRLRGVKSRVWVIRGFGPPFQFKSEAGKMQGNVTIDPLARATAVLSPKIREVRSLNQANSSTRRDSSARRRPRQGKNLNDAGVSLLDPIKRPRLLVFTSSRSTAEAVETGGVTAGRSAAVQPPE
jgi:hypothetical protein